MGDKTKKKSKKDKKEKMVVEEEVELKKKKKKKKSKKQEEVPVEPVVEKKKKKKSKKVEKVEPEETPKKKKKKKDKKVEPEVTEVTEVDKKKKKKKDKKRKKEKVAEEVEEIVIKKSKVEEVKPVAEEPFVAPIQKSNKSPMEDCCRVFMGNLSFKIDENSLGTAFASCGEIVEVQWLTDKESGKFYGSGFAIFAKPEAARMAVSMAGMKVLGRPVKVSLAPAKEGSMKPKAPPRALSEKKEGCVTLFAGNLSFEIDEEQIKQFFEPDCGEIKAIRFLTHQDSGDFKGCGFFEFFEESSVDEAIKKNGERLLGRPLRLDYA